jgi:hypothetical protein
MYLCTVGPTERLVQRPSLRPMGRKNSREMERTKWGHVLRSHMSAPRVQLIRRESVHPCRAARRLLVRCLGTVLRSLTSPSASTKARLRSSDRARTTF